MGKFALRKLIVDKACGEKLKILDPGEYIFTDNKYDSFFMDGVVVQAIVGKNGCGKSSLVELLFRMSNNLAAMMLHDYSRTDSDKTFFIKDVVAELHYDMDDKHGVLKCKDDGVELCIGDEIFCWSIFDGDCIHIKNGVTQQDETRFSKELQAAASYFYTIATNYSVQSYIADDFASEAFFEWKVDENDPNKKKKWLLSDSDISWINRVFHKNDGYMCTIVLNPYRKNGKLDMEAEERLAINRLSALLWETQNDESKFQFIDGYRLCNLKYTFKPSILTNKFSSKVLDAIPNGTTTEKFVRIYNQTGSYAKAVLDSFGYDVSMEMSVIERCLRIYLVYKTFKIAEKYPSYYPFDWIGDTDNTFRTMSNSSLLGRIKELVEKINNDQSHITYKIRQTKILIERISKLSDTLKRQFENPFSYGDYCQILGFDMPVSSIDERLSLLPPPFFKPDIFLVKTEEYDKSVVANESRLAKLNRLAGTAVHISKLSSGERQFIFMTTTLLYHALNLKSIPDDERIAYKNICMVLDEIEICFHPEYQRTFISNFLALIRRTGLTQRFGINVLIVTHSPFVLSDLPKGNILYLKEGVQQSKEQIANPFGANINDILKQSFFLDNGFMGEFSRNCTKSLIHYLNPRDNDGFDELPDFYQQKEWSYEKAKDFINEIGEPLLKNQLQQIFRQSVRIKRIERIQELEKEIEMLKNEEYTD